MTWHPDIPEDYRNEIVIGSMSNLDEFIPDDSIDLIFCDPPYLEQYLYLYDRLGQVGMRILKQGAYLFAYGGVEHMPRSLRGILSGGLTFFWVDALLHNGGYPRVWYKKLMSGYKPILIATKGKPAKLAWKATVHADSMDKQHHEWGQGIGYALKTIEMLTKPDDVVFDPFCGGGTVPAACKMLGRNYIAFEIDKATAEHAQDRVAHTQRPLFVPEFEQLSYL